MSTNKVKKRDNKITGIKIIDDLITKFTKTKETDNKNDDSINESKVDPDLKPDTSKIVMGICKLCDKPVTNIDVKLFNAEFNKDWEHGSCRMNIIGFCMKCENNVTNFDFECQNIEIIGDVMCHKKCKSWYKQCVSEHNQYSKQSTGSCTVNSFIKYFVSIFAFLYLRFYICVSIFVR